LSIHFGEEKTKSILFARNKNKNVNKLKINRNDIQIKQHSQVTYLGCILDERFSGESMATKMLAKINGRLAFLYRKQTFLTYRLRRLLTNALIQPHFDYACAAWYPILNSKLSKKIQTAQNKCVRFCLNLKSTTHLEAKHFQKINWLPTRERFEQCICANIFRFFNNTSPAYSSEMFKPAADQSRSTRRSKDRLYLPLRKSNPGQKCLSYLGPKLWNNLSTDLKSASNKNTFKHKIKSVFMLNIQEKENNASIYH
jgi:hypothetical protein